MALLLCVAALAANAVMGVMYFQQQSEQESPTSELTAARGALTEYVGSASSLEEQLAAAEARLTEEQLAIAEARLLLEQAYPPDRLSSGSILNSVLQLAQESKVNVVEVSTQPEGDEERNRHTYSTLSIDLQVTGSLRDLAAFVSKLEKGEIGTVVIDEISIAGTADPYTASLDFSVLYPRS